MKPDFQTLRSHARSALTLFALMLGSVIGVVVMFVASIFRRNEE